MNRLATGAAGLVVLVSLTSIPSPASSAATAASSASASTSGTTSPLAPAGRSEVVGRVTDADRTRYAYDSGTVRHQGRFALDRRGEGLQIDQTSRIGAHTITSNGTTQDVSTDEVTTTARNHVKVSFTPTRTARWRVQVRATRLAHNDEGIYGSVVIGQPGHRPFVKSNLDAPKFAPYYTYRVDRTVTLRAGVRYAYTAGHGTTTFDAGGFTWSIRLTEDVGATR